MQTNQFNSKSLPANSILHGDCIETMHSLLENTVDFILTDPPYLVRYKDREGRSVQNDNQAHWLKPAFAECYRVLKPDSLMIAFYGWTQADKFIDAWRSVGFRIVGHLVFRKTYSSKARFLRYQHEQAYLLAKGKPKLPDHPIPDVIDMPYSGNKLHPTQKPVPALTTLIEAFTQPNDLVLDPFCGSGSTLWRQRSPSAGISASTWMRSTTRSLSGGSTLRAFVRSGNVIRRCLRRRQGRCRRPASAGPLLVVAYAQQAKLQWSSTSGKPR